MPLDAESVKLVTINTQKGVHKIRLTFAVSSAPAIFQRAMDAIIQGLPHIICYVDDIVVTEKEHMDNQEEVLRQLKEKCSFFNE